MGEKPGMGMAQKSGVIIFSLLEGVPPWTQNNFQPSQFEMKGHLCFFQWPSYRYILCLRYIGMMGKLTLPFPFKRSKKFGQQVVGNDRKNFLLLAMQLFHIAGNGLGRCTLVKIKLRRDFSRATYIQIVLHPKPVPTLIVKFEYRLEGIWHMWKFIEESKKFI